MNSIFNYDPVQMILICIYLAHKIEKLTEDSIYKEVKYQKQDPIYRDFVHFGDPDYNKLELQLV